MTNEVARVQAENGPLSKEDMDLYAGSVNAAKSEL